MTDLSLEIEKNKQNRLEHLEFLDRLRDRITDHDLKLIDFAYDLAKYGHRNQVRDNGERYFEHCRRTALILIEELELFQTDLIIIALLHDMLEDNYLLNDERLRLIFGDCVAELVKQLTKPKKTDGRFNSDASRHQWYFGELNSANPDAKLIKLCDRLQNMRDINHCDPQKRQRKVRETRRVYLPLLEDVKNFFPKEAEIISKELNKALAQADLTQTGE